MKCGPCALELAGIPAAVPNSLLRSLIHQHQLQFPVYPFSPSNFIRQLQLSLDQHKQFSESHHINRNNELQSVSDCFNVRILLYIGDERQDFLPNGVDKTISWTAQLYTYSTYYFDSIVKVTPHRLIHDPVPSSSGLNISMSSWNVRGATDPVKQLMIDSELKRENVSIAGIQESHLWATSISSPNYYWILGPQFSHQNRASRGLGFLIIRKLYPYIQSFQFSTPNIGYVIFNLPYIAKPLCFINVHKCSSGSSLSSIEAGK